MAAAGVDSSLSFSTAALSAQWRSLRSERRLRGHGRMAETSSTSATRPDPKDPTSKQMASQVAKSALMTSTSLAPLPQCLRSVPISFLGLGMATNTSTATQLLPSTLTYGERDLVTTWLPLLLLISDSQIILLSPSTKRCLFQFWNFPFFDKIVFQLVSLGFEIPTTDIDFTISPFFASAAIFHLDKASVSIQQSTCSHRTSGKQ